MALRITESEFINSWKRNLNPRAVAAELGLTLRQAYQRRVYLEKKLGIVLPTIGEKDGPYTPRVKFERRRTHEVRDGIVVIFSDAHFYPGEPSVACRALVALIPELKPDLVVCNGDALDGTQISRHDPTRGWHQPPSLLEQITAMQEQMAAIQSAAGKRTRLLMTLGNHDVRLSRYLAVNAPHVENLPGTQLEDYIPAWPLSWTIEINGNTMVRHRHLSGGAHSTYQSPIRAGMHYVHGHLHNLNVRLIPHYNRFDYGVDTGSLADAESDAFDYTEDGIPHVQGFAVLTYRAGQLLMPEVAYVQGGTAYFRSEAIT